MIMKKRDTRGISAMIGYVLLISAMLVMWFIVFQWLKTYIPKESLECPDDVSLVIQNVECTVDGEMIIKVMNNGLFDIYGFVLRGNARLAENNVDAGTLDISKGYFYFTPPVVGEYGKVEPDGEETAIFGGQGETNYIIESIEIVPLRMQETEDKEVKTVVCNDAKLKKDISDLYCIIRLEE